MDDDREKHFKKSVPKPWVLEVVVQLPPDSSHKPKGVSNFKFRYATEKAAKQAQSKQVENWARYKDLVVTSTISRKP